MCYFEIHNTPTLLLTGTLAKVPHSTDTNLQIIQLLPCAANPREQVVLNVCLPREALVQFGRALINES